MPKTTAQTHTPGPKTCACRVAWVERYPTIVYCPTHKAAPDLLEAAKIALSCLEDPISRKWSQVDLHDELSAAIAKAEGRE